MTSAPIFGRTSLSDVLSANRVLAAACGWLLAGSLAAAGEMPFHSAELVLPLDNRHNHAPGIAELAGGELIVSWYRGSGERSADDVAVYGARLKKGQTCWSDCFLMADTPGFPDCNTCLMVDGQGRLWLFWPVILANTWESCLTRYQVSNRPGGDGPPKWDDAGLILLKPADFQQKAQRILDEELAKYRDHLSARDLAEIEEVRRRLGDRLYQRLGWQPRCKPTVSPGGRILLPLYTDTFSISIMAISDDGGSTWYASEPLLGFGNIQPAVLRRDDGTLVAYMRENGPRKRVRICESKDDGRTWGPVGVGDLPNPGSGLDGVRLADGNWLLVYNDTIDGRSSLAVSLSGDEGKTWEWTRHLERHDSGAYHYPAIIQTSDGLIHCVYSYFVEGGKSIKHAAFNTAWIKQADDQS